MSRTREAFEKLFANEMEMEEARDFLISLYEKGESVEDITDAVEVMRSYSVELPIDDELKERVIDIVGTGGDRSGSFNISTTVSLLVSSLGAVVAKHGNRSITSRSGSADVLEALGMNLSLGVQEQVKMLQESGFCFIFAMKHHPAMKHIMPVRRSIEHRTIFNIMGPLTNPAGARKYLMGVFSPEYIEKMAQVLARVGAKKAYVLSSEDGMDEISISADTHCCLLENGEIRKMTIRAQDYGFDTAPKEAVMGGDAEENAKIIHEIFSGERGPKRDIVVLNAIFALLADTMARDAKEAKEMIEESLESGRARKHLEKVLELSRKLSS